MTTWEKNLLEMLGEQKGGWVGEMEIGKSKYTFLVNARYSKLDYSIFQVPKCNFFYFVVVVVLFTIYLLLYARHRPKKTHGNLILICCGCCFFQAVV